MKLILLIAMSISLFSQEIKVFTEGHYFMSIVQWEKTHDINLLKRQSKLIATQKAIESAGVTVYTSMLSEVDVKKHGSRKESVRKTTTSKIESIAAGLIKTKILSEKKIHTKEHIEYITKIEATVEIANAEEVFAKADNRMKKIAKLQNNNKQIAKKLDAISMQLFKILNKGVSYELKEPQKIIAKQEELLEQYDKNVKNIKVSFTKGALARKYQESIFEDNVKLNAAKRKFDSSFTAPFHSNFKIEIKNVRVRKWRGYPFVEFDLKFGVSKRFYTSFRNTPYFRGMSYAKPTFWHRYSFSEIRPKDNYIAKELFDWIDKNRNFAIKVTIGDQEYFTERVTRTGCNRYQGSGVRSDASNRYCFGFLDSDSISTKRAIFNIPMKALESAEFIKAELVMVDANKYKFGRAIDFDVRSTGVKMSFNEAQKYYTSERRRVIEQFEEMYSIESVDNFDMNMDAALVNRGENQNTYTKEKREASRKKYATENKRSKK